MSDKVQRWAWSSVGMCAVSKPEFGSYVKGSDYERDTAVRVWQTGHPKKDGQYLVTTISGALDVDCLFRGEWTKYYTIEAWMTLPISWRSGKVEVGDE